MRVERTCNSAAAADVKEHRQITGRRAVDPDGKRPIWTVRKDMANLMQAFRNAAEARECCRLTAKTGEPNFVRG